jgi:hypothetical protein
VQSVHPSGQPISHSTNGGFRTIDPDDRGPSVDIVGPGREQRELVSQPGRSVPPSRCPRKAPLPSRAWGTAQKDTAVAISRPDERRTARSVSVVPWGLSPPGFPPDERPTAAVAAGHIFTRSVRLVIAVLGPPGIRRFAAFAASGERFESLAAGVGQRGSAVSQESRGVPLRTAEVAAPGSPGDEQAPAEVGSTDGGRGEQVPFRIEPEVGQVPENRSQSGNSEPWDVLQQDEVWSHLTQNPGDVGPDPPLVLDAASNAGLRERLTRETGRDEIHSAAPRSAVEGRDVVPDRSRIQGLVRHPRHEDGRRMGVPLDVTHSPVPAGPEDELEAELNPSGPGTHGEATKGTCNHTHDTPSPGGP